MTVVGLIPARAGSKRFPGKNLAPLAGRPLLTYTCEAALDSGVLAAVYVNTDSREIAEVAQQYGVSCPVLRPPALAADETPTRDSNLFLLNYLLERGERYDAVMVLQPTSPLRTAADIRTAWAVFEEHAPCAVASVSPVAPRAWLGELGPDGRFDAWEGTTPVYRLNGAIYVHRLEDYLHDRPPPKRMAYIMPATRGVDIDRREDLEYAEFLLHRRQSATPSCALV